MESPTVFDRKSIFRSAALERLRSPEQLDQLLQVTSPRGWLALLTLGFLILLTLLWGIGGRIPEKVAGKGILLRGGRLGRISATSSGQLSQLSLTAGAAVRKGDPVARIVSPTLVTDLAPEAGTSEGTGGPGEPSPGAETQPTKAEDLKTESARQAGTASRVLSPASGRVVEVWVDAGGMVEVGDTLALVELSEEPLRAVIYAPLKAAEGIRPGMAVELSLSGLPREGAGILMGKAVRVSELPATRAGMMRALGNEVLVEGFLGLEARLEVLAELLPDPATPSGFRWTSGKGPAGELRSGTQCAAEIVVRDRRPISLLLPSFGP